MYNIIILLNFLIIINPLTLPCAGAPALKYGNVNTETSSPGEAKGLINLIFDYKLLFLFYQAQNKLVFFGNLIN